MEIYLLRHGIAEPRRAGKSDAERKLTEEGRQGLRRVLARARDATVAPSLILSSPLVRAIETAEMAAESLGYQGTIQRTGALLPASSPQEVWRELRGCRDEAAILLAGHEPLMSELASFLLETSRVLIEVKKGALLRIDVADSGAAPSGMLRWLLTPKLAGKGGA